MRGGRQTMKYKRNRTTGLSNCTLSCFTLTTWLLSNEHKKLYTKKTLQAHISHPTPPAHIWDFFTDSQNWDEFHMSDHRYTRKEYNLCLTEHTVLAYFTCNIIQYILGSIPENNLTVNLQLFLWLSFKVCFFFFF